MEKGYNDIYARLAAKYIVLYLLFNTFIETGPPWEHFSIFYMNFVIGEKYLRGNMLGYVLGDNLAICHY